MPTTWPSRLSSGPPELPGLTAASTWIRPVRVCPLGSVNDRPSAETTPELIESASPNGLPTANTSLPTRSSPGLPSVAACTPDGTLIGCSTAMSSSGWVLLTTACAVEPSAKVTVIALAPSTTWSAVMMSPWSSTTTPLPREPTGSPLDGGAEAPGAAADGAGDAAPAALAVWITTTDGAIRAQAVSEKAGAGVTDASADAIAWFTWAGVRGGAGGNAADQTASATSTPSAPAATGARRPAAARHRGVETAPAGVAGRDGSVSSFSRFPASERATRHRLGKAASMRRLSDKSVRIGRAGTALRTATPRMRRMPTHPLHRALAALALAVIVAACGGSPAGSPSGLGPTAGPSRSATPAASPASSAPTTPAASGSAASAASSAGPAVIGPTSGGLTLVEPLRELPASEGSVTLTPAGSLATLQAGGDAKLHAPACAVSCGNPATWTDTVLDAGAAFSHPLVRSREDGGLAAVVDATGSAQPAESLGFCDVRCDSAASWRWTRLPLPPDATAPRNASRYFAVGGGGMILGLGSGSPMSALVCGGTCDAAASWIRIKFSAAACSAPSVAAGADGAMAFACDTVDSTRTPPMSTEVWSCRGACTDQANWSGVQGVAAGTSIASDVTVGPGGMVGLAVSLGEQATSSMANRLGWFQCLGGCGEPSAWHGIVVGSETLYAPRVAAVTDVQARTLIAYDGVSSQGSGLLAAVCQSSCTTPSSWTVAVLDDGTRVSGQIPVAPPAGCQATAWVPDNVTDVTMRGDWAATSSGYSAVGTGGTCGTISLSPAAVRTPIRSVVSLAILGP
jgi:hypothetical protein